MNMSFLKPVSRYAGRTALVLRKYSPQILMATGAITGVASTVMACKATLRAEEVLDAMHADLDVIEEAHETCDVAHYSEKEYKQDLLMVYTRTAVDFGKLYGPAIILGGLSLTSFFGAHRIMFRRQAALMATYQLLRTKFSEYRERVIADVGSDKDLEYRGIGVRKLTVTEQDDEGNMVEVDKTLYSVKDPSDWIVTGKHLQ